MKTYKEFTEAAALAIPAAMKMAPYVIPAIGAAAAKVLQQQVMPIDASDKFKARQRGGRISPGEAQRRQAREDRKAEAEARQRAQARRARENATKDKPTVENVPTAKKQKEKVDPRLERAAGQILDRLKNEEVQSEGAALAIKAGSSLIPKIMTGIGAVGTLMQATRAEKDAANERRRQLAKEHGLDPTKPGDRAKLGRLMKQTGDAKGRASKGDTRSPEQYRKDKAEDNKIIDAARKSLGQSKAKVGTKERTKIDKELKDFRDELRDVKPEPSTRAKVRVKVGQEVPKPDTTQPPRTGASPQKVRDRRSYEAQQRRNRKRDAAQDIPEGMLPVPSDKRKRIINPMIAAMPPKTDKGINDAMKKGLDGLNDKYQKLYDKLNSVPKDRGKA